jgi:hypothetical protein
MRARQAVDPGDQQHVALANEVEHGAELGATRAIGDEVDPESSEVEDPAFLTQSKDVATQARMNF